MKNTSPRLNKFLAEQGIGSRRQIDRWIEDGEITKNGKIVSLGEKYEEGDAIALHGKRVVIHRASETSPPLLLIYNKPLGVVSTRKDPEDRPTIFDNLPKLRPDQGRWIQIGRLDVQTSGLILFTNDGDIANTLMHPSAEIEREYIAKVRGAFNAHSSVWTKGANVGDETRIIPSHHKLLEELETSYWVRLVLKEGRYRAVRRFFDSMHQTVVKLKRSRFGTIKLHDDEIAPGDYKLASQGELNELLEAATKR